MPGAHRCYRPVIAYAGDARRAAPVHEIFISYSSRHRAADGGSWRPCWKRSTVQARSGGTRTLEAARSYGVQIRQGPRRSARRRRGLDRRRHGLATMSRPRLRGRSMRGKLVNVRPCGHCASGTSRRPSTSTISMTPRTTSASCATVAQVWHGAPISHPYRSTRSTSASTATAWSTPSRSGCRATCARSARPSCCRPSTPWSPTPTSPAWPPSCWTGAPPTRAPQPAAWSMAPAGWARPGC